jgi:FAD/FMN-containing dehydrogenase
LAGARREIAGGVVLPGTPAYDEQPWPFNARFHDRRPQAIAGCARPEDGAATVAFAGRHGLRPVARSGGHCFGSRSSTRGVVLDVSPMSSIAVSAAW